MHKLTFLFCLSVLTISIVQGQPKYVTVTGKNVFKQTTNIILVNKLAKTVATTNRAKTISQSMLVSPLFYSNNLAFFCRQEIKLEKLTKIPFKFRLGSLQYVDYLEGKAGTSYYKQ